MVAAIGRAMVQGRVDFVLWMPVMLATGIGGYFAAPVEPSVAVRVVLGMCALVAGIGLYRAPPACRMPAGCIALVALGILVADARARSVAAPVLSYRYFGAVEGRVVKIDRSSRDLMRLTLDQVVLDRISEPRTPAKVRVSLHAATDRAEVAAVQPGARVRLRAHLQPPNGPVEPGAWDFRLMAWFSGLGAVGYSRSPVQVLAQADASDLVMAGHRARMALSHAMQARMDGQAGAVAAALLTGDRSGISEATNEAMRVSNLYHIVSISGLHMAMVTGFVFGLIRYGLAATGRFALILPVKKIAAVAGIAAASLYLWVAGPEIATQRAYLMAVVMLLAVLFDRRAVSLRTVALAALVLMILRPEALTEPGFQMSFAATVGLIVSYQGWATLSQGMPAWVRPTAALVFTSLVAGMVTGPIAATHFNRGSAYGLLANFLVVPVMGTLVMPGGVVAAMLAPFGLASPALWVMELGTRWMIFISHWIAGLKGASIMIASPPDIVLPMLGYGAVAMVLAGRAGRWIGGAILTVACLLWALSDRPALLIAAEGEQVGLMTPQGRAVSKPVADYVATNWLEADGDRATLEDAAARAGFDAGDDGDKTARVARWRGRSVVHLTGKGADARLARYCHDGALIVVAVARAPQVTGECDIWDRTRLRATGALSFDADGHMQTAQRRAGHRYWTDYRLRGALLGYW